MHGSHVRVRMHTPTSTNTCVCSYKICDKYFVKLKYRSDYVQTFCVLLCNFPVKRALTILHDIRFLKHIYAPAALQNVKKKHTHSCRHQNNNKKIQNR